MNKWLEHLFSLRRLSNNDPLEKPFLEHLEDLRWMLIKMAIALGSAMVFGIIFRIPLAEILQDPLDALLNQVESPFILQSLNPVESITVTFKLAFYAGLVIAFPFLLYFLAEFILPGLSQQEKKFLVPGVGISFALFTSGVLFNYFLVLPQTLQFFFVDQARFGWTQQWSVGMYYSFVTQMSVGFGAAFELPIVVLLLVKIGLIDYKLMSSTRPHTWVIFFFLSAVITPTQDILTLMLMAMPMIVLYEICIWITFFMERKERRELAAEGLLVDEDEDKDEGEEDEKDQDDQDDHGDDDDHRDQGGGDDYDPNGPDPDEDIPAQPQRKPREDDARQ
jgi:sec-independent protein translocase protein TatC